MEQLDPLERIETIVRDTHEQLERQVHPVHQKYPLFFLLLITASIAALFHGLDLFMDHFSFLTEYPLALMFLGIGGLFVSGALYKRLGKDKFD